MTSDTAIPTPPPAIRKTDFMAWLAKAVPGEKIEYHRGHLSIDRHQESSPFRPLSPCKRNPHGASCPWLESNLRRFCDPLSGSIS